MTALATRPPRTARPTWGQSFWAVVGASVFAFAATLLVLLALWALGLSLPTTEGTTGRGWPWRVEGPWSLAADVGPLLLAGSAFALGVEAFISRHTEVPTWRLPIALTAALLGWIAIGGVSNAGPVPVGGLGAFALLVVVSREAAARGRPRLRWTPVKAWSALIIGLTLAATSLSYGLLHPLTGQMSYGSTDQPSLRGYLVNQGRADVQILAITARGVQTVRFNAGETVSEPLDGGAFELVVACPQRVATIDRLNVRMRVLGQEVQQVVRLENPLTRACG